MARLFTPANNDRLTVSAAAATALPLTLAGWGRCADTTSARCLLSLSDGANDNAWIKVGFRGDLSGDPVTAEARQGGTAQSASGYSANTWVHICGVFVSATSRTAYLNGENTGTNATSGSPAGLNFMSIGLRSGNTSAELMNGRIAHAAIWNVDLSAAEIAALAKGINPLRIRPQALIGYWPLTGASPEPDWSGKKNNMTVVGAVVADSPRVGTVMW